ncbi:MAG: hypothetical protein ACUVQP_04970, partial [Bacteroidales bacterium]
MEFFVSEINKSDSKNSRIIFFSLFDKNELDFSEMYTDWLFIVEHYAKVIKIPFDVAQLKDIANNMDFPKEYLRPGEIEKLYDNIRKLMCGKETKNSDILRHLGGKIACRETFLEKEHRTEFFSGFMPKEELFTWYLDLDIANSLSVYNFFRKAFNEQKFKIRIIDDNFESFKKVLDTFQSKETDMGNKNQQGESLDYFIDIKYIDPKKYDDVNKLINEIIEDKDKKDKIDIILLDLYYKKGVSTNAFTGADVLVQLRWKYPGIPIFILSKSHDIEKIKEMSVKEAEFFITKSRIAGLPWFIYKFLSSTLGNIICELGDYRQPFLHSITKWIRNRTYLWHGEKTYHMVGHTIEHSRTIWRLIDKLYNYGALNVLTKNQSAGNKKIIFYSLLLSVWLHDIGYKGDRRISEPYLVRKNHPIISAELIWRDYRYSTKNGREPENLVDSRYFSEF